MNSDWIFPLQNFPGIGAMVPVFHPAGAGTRPERCDAPGHEPY
jgi:hypothetical protein